MSINQQDILLCIFPYVHISEPITLRGIRFFPSQSIDDNSFLCEVCKSRLRELIPLFFWHDNTNIPEMMCTTFHLTKGEQSSEHDFYRRLEEVRIALGYINCVPDDRYRMPLYGNYEQIDYFLFRPDAWITPSLVHCAELKNHQHNPENPAERIEGYVYYRNLGSIMWATTACRLYPDTAFTLKRQFDLTDDLMTIEYQRDMNIPEVNWVYLLDEKMIDRPLQTRLFRSLEWYNRSCKAGSTTDVALVWLAVAFETLLGVKSDQDADIREVRRRLRDSISVLIGAVPRLISWFEQFYHARSRIVHEGYWSHLGFYLIDDHDVSSLRSKRDNEPNNVDTYGYLIHYGHLIFRICFNAVMAGVLKTSQLDLRSKFFNHQERLEEMQSILDKASDAKAALVAVIEHVSPLYRYQMDGRESVKIQTVISVGKKLVERFLKTDASISTDLRAKLHKVLEESPYHLREYEYIQLKERLRLVLSNAEFLPQDKVVNPALKALEGEIKLGEIGQNIKNILDDSRNKAMPPSLRETLENIVLLIDDIIIEGQLIAIAGLSTGISGDILKEHDLYSIVDAYGQFTRSVSLGHHIRWRFGMCQGFATTPVKRLGKIWLDGWVDPHRIGRSFNHRFPTHKTLRTLSIGSS